MCFNTKTSKRLLEMQNIVQKGNKKLFDMKSLSENCEAIRGLSEGKLAYWRTGCYG